MSEPRKIGFDVTRQIEQHMATYPLPSGFEQHVARLPIPESERENTVWLARFMPSAVEVSVILQSKGYGRGFVLADRMGSLRAWYVRRADLEKAVTRATPETIEAIQTMLSTYKPNREGVMIIYTMDTIRPIHLNAQGQMSSPGVFARIPLNKQEPITLPPGVTTTRVETGTDVTYIYKHETLGDLGSVSIYGFGVQSKFQVNIAPGNPDDPSYQQRLTLFQSMVIELDQKFHGMLGEPVPDQTWLTDMTETMPLYSAFLAADSSLELDKLIRTLTPEQIQIIIKQAKTSMPLASLHDAEAIQQRLDDLARLQTMPQTFTASLRGLSQFVQASTDSEARALLLAQPDLLLSEAAEREWDELLAPDEATYRHIQQRKLLWQKVRREYTSGIE